MLHTGDLSHLSIVIWFHCGGFQILIPAQNVCEPEAAEKAARAGHAALLYRGGGYAFD